MRTRLGKTKQGKMYLATSLILLVGSIYGVAAYAKHSAETPIYTTGNDVADVNTVGNIDQAVQQTQTLLTALQGANYDPAQLPNLDLMMLPDAQFAELADERQPNSSSYCFPDASVPEQSQIACFTDIYARKNTSYYTGDTSNSAPSGYYIVAWKNGTVQKVPVSDVRLLPRADGSLVDCFPGMNGYDPALRVWGK